MKNILWNFYNFLFYIIRDIIYLYVIFSDWCLGKDDALGFRFPSRCDFGAHVSISYLLSVSSPDRPVSWRTFKPDWWRTLFVMRPVGAAV